MNPKAPMEDSGNLAPNNDASSLLFHRIKVQIAHQGTEESNEGNMEIGISCIKLAAVKLGVGIIWLISLPGNGWNQERRHQLAQTISKHFTFDSIGPLQPLMIKQLIAIPRSNQNLDGCLQEIKNPRESNKTWGKRHDEDEEKKALEAHKIRLEEKTITQQAKVATNYPSRISTLEEECQYHLRLVLFFQKNP